MQELAKEMPAYIKKMAEELAFACHKENVALCACAATKGDTSILFVGTIVDVAFSIHKGLSKSPEMREAFMVADKIQKTQEATTKKN